MRLLELSLLAYGPFTGALVDLSEGKEGLHIIYGPNEAGKSAALRAIESLFFGVPGQTADNFIHDNTRLRIGATIQRTDKTKLKLFRRKGTKNTLLDADERPLPDAELSACLGGVTREIYTTMFGLSHQTLIDGGKLLLTGGGALGESIFAASMGISNLRNIMQGLQQEAETIFMPGGRKKLINSLISDYTDIKKKIHARSLSSRDWGTYENSLKEAKLSHDKVRSDLSKLQIKEKRMARLLEALPVTNERQEYVSRLENLENVPLLPVMFATERAKLVSQMDRARTDLIRAGHELEKIESHLQILAIPENLLTQGSQVTEIYKRLGSNTKARLDLPGLEGAWKRLRSDQTRILMELRPDLTLDEVHRLRLTETQRLNILDLGARCQAIQDEQMKATQALEELEANLEEAGARLTRLEAPKNLSRLRTAIRLAQKQGDLEEKRRNLQTRLDNEEKHGLIEFQALPMRPATLEELESLPAPSQETVERFRSEFEEKAGSLRNLNEKSKEKREEAEKAGRKVKALHLAGEVPTEQELSLIRERRDKGWNLVRRAWLNKEDVTEEAQALDPAVPLPDFYEKSVIGADTVADRLRREAQRVEQLAQLLATIDQCREKLQELDQVIQKIGQDRKTQEKNWAEIWQAVGVKPGPPREMMSWLKQREKLVERSKRIREYRLEAEGIDNLIQEHVKSLTTCLAELGEVLPPEKISLIAILDSSQDYLVEKEKLAADRENLSKEMRSLQKRVGEAARRKHQAEARLAEWKELWISSLTNLGLPATTSPHQAHSFINKTQELFEKIDKAKELEERVAGIKDDETKFNTDVLTLLGQVAPDLLGRSTAGACEELNGRLNKAREDKATQKELARQKQEKTATIFRAEGTIEEVTGRLTEMCRKAGCSSPEQLEEIEEKSTLKKKIEDRIQQLDQELRRISRGGGMTTEELVAQAGGLDPDELGLRIEELKKAIEEHTTTLAEIDRTIGRAESELKGLSGGEAAAEAAEEAQDVLAQISHQAEHYMRLRLASAILGREIERYREANQDPILLAGGQYFSKLTLGSFSGLKPSYDNKDNPILVGLRPSGEEVTVEAMSDGACDQLYLSLRLAALERHVQEMGPLPFILDDILVNFDDDRSKATLKALAELSNKNQIIYFTHHAHILTLAREAVAPEILKIQNLVG
ncbi:MAG: AAA family ATPase [Deltaproteobacteria bacterium]|nr:AAA family ATPase [Deltaproteobacteria bacterium]